MESRWLSRTTACCVIPACRKRNMAHSSAWTEDLLSSIHRLLKTWSVLVCDFQASACNLPAPRLAACHSPCHSEDTTARSAQRCAVQLCMLKASLQVKYCTSCLAWAWKNALLSSRLIGVGTTAARLELLRLASLPLTSYIFR